MEKYTKYDWVVMGDFNKKIDEFQDIDVEVINYLMKMNRTNNSYTCKGKEGQKVKN